MSLGTLHLIAQIEELYFFTKQEAVEDEPSEGLVVEAAKVHLAVNGELLVVRCVLQFEREEEEQGSIITFSTLEAQ